MLRFCGWHSKGCKRAMRATTVIMRYCDQPASRVGIRLVLHRAKLLKLKHATNKSCPDRSTLPPVRSISQDFDSDYNKIFQGSSHNLKSEKKRATVPPSYDHIIPTGGT